MAEAYRSSYPRSSCRSHKVRFSWSRANSGCRSACHVSTSPILSDWAYARRTERQKRLLKSYPRHLFHGTNYETPGHNGKKVATFHDLTVLTHPEFHPEVRVKRTRIMLERGARECDAIITVSEHSRREIIEQLSVEQDRVFVTPLAARPGFKPRSSAETEESRARYGLRYGGYILFCGTLEPRKNLLTLLRAYELLPLSVRKRWPLVVAGGLGWKSADIERALSAACNSGQVIVTGYIDDPTLCNLFSAAAVFVLPSITEGFGLPSLRQWPRAFQCCVRTPAACQRSQANKAPALPLMTRPGLAVRFRNYLKTPASTRWLPHIAFNGRTCSAGKTVH
jgi:glycosyltransferase involved in cell wall biosynthesis